MMIYGEEGHGVWFHPLFVGFFERREGLVLSPQFCIGRCKEEKVRFHLLHF